jgi:hypothetical protein
LRNVEYFVTSSGGDDFHWKPVRKNSEIATYYGKKIVICASSFETYIEISEILKERDLVAFKDYVWSRAYGKKLVVVNANCHGRALIQYLNMSRVFEKEYFVYPLPELQDNKEGIIPEEVLKSADIFIHQDIRPDNMIGYMLSDEYTVGRLKADCLNITIPNLVGMGHWMFPNLGKNRRRNGIPFYRDIVLDEAKNNTDCTFEEIKKYWESYEFSYDELEELFHNDIDKLISREQNWSIKISDFILNNYKNIPMFVDCDHPSKYIMIQICRSVAKMLDVVYIDDGNFESCLGLINPILPSVSKYYNLCFEQYPMETKSYLGIPIEDMEDDHIRDCMWWFYDMTFDECS